jgi:hypothetical protein
MALSGSTPADAGDDGICTHIKPSELLGVIGDIETGMFCAEAGVTGDMFPLSGVTGDMCPLMEDIGDM